MLMTSDQESQTSTTDTATSVVPATPAANPSAASATIVRFRIGGDVIAKVCEQLGAEQRAAIKWAAAYCRQRNLSPEEFGSQLTQPGSDRPYSGDSVYQAFTGRRDLGSLERFCEAVDALRKRVEETDSRNSRGLFVETRLTQAIWRTCRAAYERHKLSFIFGSSQIGKTTALARYAERHNHGETVLVRMPTRGTLGDFLQELAIRLGVGTHAAVYRDKRRRIIECFDDRTLLIVDECHQCLESDRGLSTLDFCREIWDRRKCGLVLCGTDVFRAGLRTHKKLRQLWLRGYRPLQLPEVPSQADLREFSRAFKLSEAPDQERIYEIDGADAEGKRRVLEVRANPRKLQDAVVGSFGLGRWVAILEDAADLAADAGARMSWGLVVAAHYNFERLEAL